MKNRFSYRFGIVLKIVLTVLPIIYLAGLFYNIFRLAGLFGLYSVNVAAEIMTMILTAVLLVCWLFIVTLHYKITDKVALKLGPIDANGGKIKVDDIVKIVQSSNDDALYVNLLRDGEGVIINVNINPKQFDAFVACLKSVNPKILFDKADIE